MLRLLLFYLVTSISIFTITITPAIAEQSVTTVSPIIFFNVRNNSNLPMTLDTLGNRITIAPSNFRGLDFFREIDLPKNQIQNAVFTVIGNTSNIPVCIVEYQSFFARVKDNQHPNFKCSVAIGSRTFVGVNLIVTIQNTN